MKLKFIRSAVVAVMSLVTAAAFATEEPTRLANLLVVENESWRSDVAVVTGESEATVRLTDCNGVASFMTMHLPQSGGALVPNITDWLCSGTKIGVVKLPVYSGAPRIWTQATYRDALGNQNVVMIPELPEALPRSFSNASPFSSFAAEYVLEGIENGTAGKSTFVALIPDGPGKREVELAVYSYLDSTTPAATETVSVEGFTFYELTTPIEFGRLTVRHVAPAGDEATNAGLFAVALVGYREAGSPRVELPRVRFGVAIE